MQPFFTDRVFQIFDKDNSGSISLQEFIDAIHQFAGQSPEDKIKFLFKVYDIDGDGLIQHRELQHVMRACMEENGMQFSEEQVNYFFSFFKFTPFIRFFFVVNCIGNMYTSIQLTKLFSCQWALNDSKFIFDR